MTSNFYLQRKLYDHEKEYTELEVIETFQIIIILAEPGAGKSSLLENFSSHLNIKKKTANIFNSRNNHDKHSILIIDALDELVRVDQSAVTNLLGKAADLEPTKLIISSRSSEWEQSYTSLVREFFETEPRVFRLYPFNESEQQQIFENYKAEEDFKIFESEVKKYNLAQLLANPQFLKIFADAYIESNRVFSDRKSIFSQAVKALAKETNNAFSVRNDLPLLEKIERTEEIFAKLLLSGSEGISTNVDGSDTLYPRIDSLIRLDNTDLYLSVLSSRLFQLAENESIHQPSHKIIAEFTAANYLVKKINADRNHISLHQCLSIIAPNGIVRDELRGLVAWMAALGDKFIQETLINIDPYAVLANGDPSQLLQSSKKYLLEKLICLVEEDPYFRRSDMWRTFSISGFFDNDSVPIVKLILDKADNGLLRGLILELLENTIILEALSPELEEIVKSEAVDKYIRELAGIRLTEIINYEVAKIINQLIDQGTKSSLSIVAHLIERINLESICFESILEFLKKCTFLYPDKNVGREITIGEHYFIKNFITNLNYELVVNLLDKLSHDLCCTCKKEQYDCYCRNGTSKIIGVLLDHYFELEKNHYDPQKIWNWLKNLNFHGEKRIEDSIAVQVLHNNDDLRHSLIKLALEGVTSIEEVHQVNWKVLSSYTHSGLILKPQDYYFILDWSFEDNNINIWSYFSPIHQFHISNRNQSSFELRRYAKLQARKKPDFLKIWTKKNLGYKESYEQTQRIVNSRSVKKGKIRRQMIRSENIQYIQNNRELIESGKHLGCLFDFSLKTLNNPDGIKEAFGDEIIVNKALKNCLPYIEPKVPNLNELAEAQCNSKTYNVEIILYASCLVIFREKGNLNGIKTELLKALFTGITMHYRKIDRDEREAFSMEVERIIFPDIESRLKFIKDYIEPQLSYDGCQHPQVHWLAYSDTFKEFQGTLPLEWLNLYPNISQEATRTLFDLSAQFGDQNKLKELIRKRCTELNCQLVNSNNQSDVFLSKVYMWFIRAFFFLDESELDVFWNYLKEQEQTIFTLNSRMEGVRHGDHPFWPVLTPTKIWWVLDRFIDQWPKVDLPDSWGTGDPQNETAYRFLSNLIWNFEKHISEETLSILNKLIVDSRFEDMQLDLKSIRSTLIRNLALINFKAPSSEEIVNFLDNDDVITVESLRAIIIEELRMFQSDLNGGETSSKDIFYNQQFQTTKQNEFKRLGEVGATLRVADRLRLRLEPKGITITPEHQLQNANRCDITFSKVINGKRKLLVLESKGQWHPELYNAASTQLSQRYSIHPHAEQQGIYFVLWFGVSEKVANVKKHGIDTPQELKKNLEEKLPNELKGLIDIFVLDVSLNFQ